MIQIDATNRALLIRGTCRGLAGRRGIAIRVGPFKVLAPSRQRYVSLIPDLDKTSTSYATEGATLRSILGDAMRTVIEKVKERLDLETLDQNPPATSASNETSVVQMATFGDRRILLTADVGPEGLDEAALYAENFSLIIEPNLVQMPHHGSGRNVTPGVLNRWLGPFPAVGRGHAVASVGKDEDIYPRKTVANAFTRRGYSVYSTQGGWINFVHGYDRRAGMIDAPVIPFSPDVED